MKANRFLLQYATPVALTACLLSALSIQGQTFTGQENLPASPASFDAVVYPVISQPTTIKVNFNNRTAGGVRVVIRNEQGRKVYDEYETIKLYRRQFDLSPMPAGSYTIELSKRNDRFVQTFTIEPPTMSYITMGIKLAPKTPELPVNKKLIVSQ